METHKILVIVVIVALNIIRWRYQIRYHFSGREVISRTKHAREWILVLMVVGSYAIPCLLWLFTDLMDFAYAFHSSALMWSGFALGVLSTLVYAWVHQTLGDNWSPVLEIRKDHELVTRGPYCWVRHPMYLSIWVGVVGMNLMMGNYLFMISSVSSTLILCFIRIPDEEKLMLDHFGESYRQYGLSTKRLIPLLY